MPDEDGNTEIDEDEAPETSLHAHGSGIEEEGGDRPREDQAEGNIVEEGEDSGEDSVNTGGATSGGPPQEDAGEDPSNV
ncbi:hypothetical protein BH24ACT23_BH24ACT23_12000 [soil metagenome]